MGMEHHVGVGVDDGVGKFYGEWAEQASLKLHLKMTLHTNSRRQSDTCFRILWQAPCSAQKNFESKGLCSHISSFCTGICFVSMKSVVNKIMCLLAQKTTYIMCSCSHLMLLTHLSEAARVILDWPGALEVEGSVEKGRINIVEQVYGWRRAFIHPIFSWYHKELS